MPLKPSPSLPSSRGSGKGVGSRVQLSRVIWGQQPHRHPHTRALNCQGSQYAACSMQTECSMNGGCALSLTLIFSLSLSLATAGRSKPRDALMRLSPGSRRLPRLPVCSSCIFVTSILTSTHTKPKEYYNQASSSGSSSM